MTFPYGIPKRALKKRLKKRGITQAALAKEAQVARTTVTHWLAGRLVSRNIERTVRRAVK